MIELDVAYSLLICFIFGFFYILQEVYHNKLQIDYSFVAGISLSYFFLILLPEVIKGLPEFPIYLQGFEYFLILVGFALFHLLDKLILQKVEKSNQKKVKLYLSQSKQLEDVENLISSVIDREILKEDFDRDALKELSITHQKLLENENSLSKAIEELEKELVFHIKKDLYELRIIVEFVYHTLAGIVLFYLMINEAFSGILFFIITFLMALIMGSPQNYSHSLFSDLEIEHNLYNEIKIKENSLTKKIFLGSSNIIGIIIGIILEKSNTTNLEGIYSLFAFIAGFILYIIIFTILPEKEKGKPKLFVFGFLVFMTFLLLTRSINYIS